MINEGIEITLADVNMLYPTCTDVAEEIDMQKQAHEVLHRVPPLVNRA
jgi:hypothetical protein